MKKHISSCGDKVKLVSFFMHSLTMPIALAELSKLLRLLMLHYVLNHFHNVNIDPPIK